MHFPHLHTLNKKTLDYYQNFIWNMLHILHETIARRGSFSVSELANASIMNFETKVVTTDTTKDTLTLLNYTTFNFTNFTYLIT